MYSQKPKFSLLTIIIFALFISSYGQTPTPTPVEDDTPETVFTEEIKLNVSAFDHSGKFVSEVKKEDLVIVEDGRLHQANSIRRVPASVLIVIDTGGEMRRAKSLQQTRSTAAALVQRLKKEDSIAVLEYNDKARILSEWTSDKAKTLGAIYKKSNFGKKGLFVDALQLATTFLKKSENENRHLVLITDGTDSLDRELERNTAMKGLMATNINVHVLSYTFLEREKVKPRTKRWSKRPPPKTLPDEVAAGLPNGVRDAANAPTFGSINLDKKMIRVLRKRQKDLEEGEKFLATLSENTSGMFILPETKDEMLEKTSLIVKTIDSNYVVTYTPKRPLSESPNGEIRNIEVSSRRIGLQVLAKRKLFVENSSKN